MLIRSYQCSMGRHLAITHELGDYKVAWELTLSCTTIADIVYDGIHSSRSSLWPPAKKNKKKLRRPAVRSSFCFGRSCHLVPDITVGGNQRLPEFQVTDAVISCHRYFTLSQWQILYELLLMAYLRNITRSLKWILQFWEALRSRSKVLLCTLEP